MVSCDLRFKEGWLSEAVSDLRFKEGWLSEAVSGGSRALCMVRCVARGGYESGVFDGCDITNVDLDHAVVVVGYGTDPTGGDYWIVRNSWYGMATAAAAPLSFIALSSLSHSLISH